MIRDPGFFFRALSVLILAPPPPLLPDFWLLPSLEPTREAIPVSIWVMYV
jgi:hypothetical protein